MTAGVMCLVKPGDYVDQGDPVLELRSDDADRLAQVMQLASDAVVVGPTAPEMPAIVVERIGPS